MTREEATAQATERQRRDTSGTWMAVQRGAEWVVMRISVPAETKKAIGTVISGPMPPRDRPVSELETIVR
jgi:hypothetical protein